MTHDEFLAIEKFATDLRRCYANFRKQQENAPDKMALILIDYAIKTLDIHLELARLKFERWGNTLEKING